MMAAGLTGSAMAVDAAAYTGALEQARALGLTLVGCAVDGEGMTAESLRAACVEGKAKGQPIASIFCTVTVHNPLGCTASLARRQQLVELAREFDLLILEDDTYGFMEPDAPARMVDLAPERTFFIGSLSKSYAPATRTGFLVAPERFDAAILAAIKNTATGSSLVHHQAACGLIADGSVDRVIEAKNREGARRNRAARALLGDRCWPGAPNAWHLWVALPVPARDVSEQLMRRGWLARPGDEFLLGDDAARFHLRLTVHDLNETDAASLRRDLLAAVEATVGTRAVG